MDERDHERERDDDDDALDGALFIDGSDGSQPRRESREDDEAKGIEARDVLVGIVSRMGLDTDVKVREAGEQVVLDITGPDAGRAIGKKGQTLDALQFIVNKIINRFPEGRRHIVLDSGDYRERREQGLASMARREAKRAVQHGRIVTLEPMSPRDRRVIHLSLAKFPGVSTRSDGEGNERRVRIIPARRRERGGDRGGRSDSGRGEGGERQPRRQD